MERLTKRTNRGAVYLAAQDNDEFFDEEAEEDIALRRLAELEDKLESGHLVELPCRVGDTVYGVGAYSCEDRHTTDKVLKRKIFNECMKRNGKCEGCKYALPAIEEFICTNIQIAEDGIWICGAKAEMHLASKIFTDKAQSEARLKELQEKGL